MIDSKEARLTVIIPVLNDGQALYDTVKNLRETSEIDFDVMIINDGSTDGFDYKRVAREFRAQYIEHEERKGPAISRDEGVELCSTEYFITIDSHMKVYQRDWASLILKELVNDRRAIFSCATMGMDKNRELYPDTGTGYGAYLNLETDVPTDTFDIHWVNMNFQPDETVVDAPCILGASYACNRNYWKQLRGLEGLVLYGYEEQLISPKAWMEGGRCRIIKNVTFAHYLNRRFQPYKTRHIEMLYDKLYVAKLLFQDVLDFPILLEAAKMELGETWSKTITNMLDQSKESIIDQQKYYKATFNGNIHAFLNENNKAIDMLKAVGKYKKTYTPF